MAARSFGCNSQAGCRFVERILTVVQTCRLNQTNTLEYLAQRSMPTASAKNARNYSLSDERLPLRFIAFLGPTTPSPIVTVSPLAGESREVSEAA